MTYRLLLALTVPVYLLGWAWGVLAARFRRGMWDGSRYGTWGPS